ncbi:MAG: hypothetical protein KDA05_02260 [Phycisphaerales bacterium]|nr:hypothetical protein [Phycisphaerales bacterium]MCB9840356.1 hypothetical protein [Phycisphaeraceae bacterium]
MARHDGRQVGAGDVGGEGARLSRVLDEVERLCAELDVLSRRQSAALDDGRPDDAAAIVEERGEVVAQLADAAVNLGRDRDGFERLLASGPAGEAERARAQAAAVAAVVAEVLARDAEDAALLAQARERIAGEMAGVGRGRAAIGAYGAGGANEPRMQDRRG